MKLATEHVERGRSSLEAKVIERIEGYYESVEVSYGVVYTWHPGGCCSSADAASRWVLPAPQPTAASVAQTTRGWFEKSSMASVRRTRLYIRGATLETARVTGCLFEVTLVLNLGHYLHYLPGSLLNKKRRWVKQARANTYVHGPHRRLYITPPEGVANRPLGLNKKRARCSNWTQKRRGGLDTSRGSGLYHSYGPGHQPSPLQPFCLAGLRA